MAEENDKKVEEKVEAKSVESEKKSAKSEVSGKFKDLIKQIEELSVLELAELVKELEERFGVSAAAPVAAAAAPAAAGAAQADEKTSYTIHLVDAGAQKIAVIKVVREIKPELGLKEAKDLVDGAPKDIKSDVPKAEAEEAKKKFEAAGAKIELK
jgi:large subunit ribosomal protein L7/L12